MNNFSKGLSGKLFLLFSVIGFVLLVFVFFLVSGMSRINRMSSSLEKVYFPMARTLELLESSFDQRVHALRQASFQRDTLGLNGSSHQINSELKFLNDHAGELSKASREAIDSLTKIFNTYEMYSDNVRDWITENLINGSSDSVFQAQLPSREQAELMPMIDHALALKDIHQHYFAVIKAEVDSKVNEMSGAIRNRSLQTRWMALGIGLAAIATLIIGGSWFFKKFTKTLTVPSNILDRLVKGEVSTFVEPTADELGMIIDSANKLSNNLKQYSAFAQSIGEGNIDFEFEPLGESDLLGNSLVQMKQKLKAINEEDRKRNWVTEGLANFADIMRKSDDYEALANHIIAELVKYTKSSQGGLFIVNRDDEKETYLQLTACYAFERRKYLQKRVDVGEGLVGQSYQEGRTIYLKEIPSNYVTITSGLGGANPSSLLIVPLKVNDIIEGVIEMASFKDYPRHEIEFVEKVGEIIASTISNARINSRTRKLLEESQQHAEELRAQEEEMRQNMEEMQATQEQMHRQAEEMRRMHEKLDLERSMFQVLMEYLPDRITYKDRDSKILRVNKAKAIRFKMNAEEMIGKTDYDYFAKDHADKAFQEEQELLRLGEPMLNIEERAVLSNGDVVWASASRIPFKNSKGETIGIFIITKDVTQLRIAEASIRDREKIIQRLLDNMPVFRYTISKNGYIADFWKSKVLGNFQSLDHKPVKDFLPEVYDLLQQEELEDTGLICKTVMDMDGEKEIFKHFLFKDSAHEGACLGFALKQ